MLRILLVLLLVPGMAAAQSWQYWSSNPEMPADAEGAADPEGLQRITGSVIIGFEQTGFDALDVVTGIEGGSRQTEAKEGPRTRLLYVMPGDQSPLEVVRNYQALLDELGFTPLFDCRGEGCGFGMASALYPSGGHLANYGEMGEYAMVDLRGDVAYAAATRDDGTTVTVFAGFNRWDLIPQIHNTTVALVNVIGTGFERRMETVTRAALAEGLSETGRVTLEGIFFDTDKDTIKPESAATLAEIAAFLGEAPDIEAYIVGHTDSVGALDYNLDLSRRRAKAVVAALVDRHGIAPARLVPAGVGPLAPQGENDTEEGRALNRRVELVKR